MADETKATEDRATAAQTAAQTDAQSAPQAAEPGCCREVACCGRQGSGEVVGLCCMASGQCGVIRGMAATGADAAYLRAMGLRPNQRIRLCRANGPWIVEVGCQGGPASRIGLARSLAEQVQVEINESLPGSSDGTVS